MHPLPQSLLCMKSTHHINKDHQRKNNICQSMLSVKSQIQSYSDGISLVTYMLDRKVLAQNRNKGKCLKRKNTYIF